MKFATKMHKTHKKHRTQSLTYGTTDIAKMCSVTPVTVAKWIDDGKLVSHLTAGGHRRVQASDVLAFMRQLNMPIPAYLENEGSPHILIVDDDTEDLELITQIVEKAVPQATVHVATGGFQVGHQIATFHPVLVVLDLRMPDIDGFVVCETIRKDPKLTHIKILAMTGVDDEKIKNKILKKGANDFLSKDTDQSIWLQKLTALLKN